MTLPQACSQVNWPRCPASRIHQLGLPLDVKLSKPSSHTIQHSHPLGAKHHHVNNYYMHVLAVAHIMRPSPNLLRLWTKSFQLQHSKLRYTAQTHKRIVSDRLLPVHLSPIFHWSRLQMTHTCTSHQEKQWRNLHNTKCQMESSIMSCKRSSGSSRERGVGGVVGVVETMGEVGWYFSSSL